MYPCGNDGCRRFLMGRRRLVIGWLVIIGLALTACLAFPPEQYSFYPPCPSHLFFGVHCAGCGATRAIGALIHGNLAQAFAYNPLFVLVLPFLLPILIAAAYAAWRGKPPPLRHVPSWLVWCLLVSVLLYTVLRNLPYPPFDSLAPHRLG